MFIYNIRSISYKCNYKELIFNYFMEEDIQEGKSV